MIITDIGWVVVHSLWQALFIGGITALVLAFVREPRARARYVIASISLALMVVVPLVTALSGLNTVRYKMRPDSIGAIEAVISFPTIIWWGSVIIPILGAWWIAGCTVCVVRIVREVRRARSLRRDGLGDPGGDVRDIVAELSVQMATSASADVRSSAHAAVPMVLGWREPLILLPEGTTSRLRPSQVRAILAHELAHVRRRDYFANLVQLAADTILFHHPAARWVSRVIRAEREYCCDDAAVRAGSEAADYARALATLEDARADCRLAVAAGSGTLLDRIQRIVGHPRQAMTPLRGIAVLTITSILAAGILILSLLVPPSLRFGAEVRPRMRAPNGVIPPDRLPAPDGQSRPRMPAR